MGREFQYLDDYSDAPWLPICVAAPLLSIVTATIILFATTFNFNKSFEPQFSLYEAWISVFGLLYFFLINYPCACATTILIGMSIDLGHTWRKLVFFWLCSMVYIVHLVLLIVPVVIFSQRGSSDGWTKAVPFTGLIVTLPLYIIYKRWVFKRLPLYEGTAYILPNKRTYTD